MSNGRINIDERSWSARQQPSYIDDLDLFREGLATLLRSRSALFIVWSVKSYEYKSSLWIVASLFAQNQTAAAYLHHLLQSGRCSVRPGKQANQDLSHALSQPQWPVYFDQGPANIWACFKIFLEIWYTTSYQSHSTRTFSVHSLPLSCSLLLRAGQSCTQDRLLSLVDVALGVHKTETLRDRFYIIGTTI